VLTLRRNFVKIHSVTIVAIFCSKFKGINVKELDLPQLKKKVNNSLKVVGKKQVLKAIIFSLDKVKFVVLAKDAQIEVVEPIIDLCKAKKVQIYLASSKQELGSIAGIDVSASVIAVMN
jgi:ribosomal protein L7Ae-like RNA K-turn-binding protein